MQYNERCPAYIHAGRYRKKSVFLLAVVLEVTRSSLLTSEGIDFFGVDPEV